MEEKKSKKIILHFVLSFCILTFAFCILAGEANAASATLFLSPPSGTYNFGDTFSVSIKVNTGGETINAAEGTLIFNPAEIRVVSISKSDSIFTLWTSEPAFSNSLGNIVFGGGTPTNFSGNSGTIIKINFQGKAVATSQVNFSSGSVLAADGKGTNILATMSGGTYIIKSASVTPPIQEYQPSPAPAPTSGVPAEPIISSSTHPDENEWYSNNDPKFTWQLPEDVTKVSYAIDQNLSTNPEFTAETLLTEISFPALNDGVWYFHINFKNSYGWGELTHRKILIDTTPPTIFKVIIDKKGELTNPSPVLYFESTDVPSGIEYYEVVIDREKKAIAKAETAAIADIKRNPFQAPLLTPGPHLVEVKAFDKAENFSLTTAEIEITPIETPEITKIPISVEIGNVLEIEGKALAGVTVKIYLQRGEEEPILEKVKADSEGNFVLSYDKSLSRGDYFVWAQAENEKGALSNATKKYALEVGLSPFLKLGRISLDYLTVIITLIVLIIGILLFFFYAWYRISLWRKKLRSETKEVSRAVYSAFKALREEVQEQIDNLDKKATLTPAEKKVQSKLKKALDISEKFISKEIKDIEKGLK